MAHASLLPGRQGTAVAPKEPHTAARQEAPAGSQPRSRLMAPGGSAFGLGQPPPVLRQPLVVQLKDIKKADGTTVGKYDALNGLESSYKSSFEGKKEVGVSYHLQNAKDAANTSKPTAVVHAHVKDAGRDIVGVSVKDAPGPGGGQWVAPASLAPATAGALRTEMEGQAPSPQNVYRIRQVARETGTWTAPHYSGADDYDTNPQGLSQGKSTNRPADEKEMVHFRLDEGEPWSDRRSSKHIYDATTGKLGKGLHKTADGARADKTILTAWANGDTL